MAFKNSIIQTSEKLDRFDSDFCKGALTEGIFKGMTRNPYDANETDDRVQVYGRQPV